MTDQKRVLAALGDAADVIEEYFMAGKAGDPKRALNQLIDVLQAEDLAVAVDRLEAGYGQLRVVK